MLSKLNLIVGLLFSVNCFGVVNGRDADMIASASSVFIYLESGERECTGVVVDAHLILTAGHCTQGAKSRGSIELSNDLKKKNVKRFKMLQWQTAPGYTESDHKAPNDIQYDFAYIVVQEDLLSGLNINRSQLAKLPTNQNELNAVLAAAGYKGTAYGYGMYKKSGRTGEKREVVMSIEPLPDYGVLKAVSQESNIGICQGDSGGGIFSRNADNTIWLLGNVSGILATEGCGSASSYAAYSSIANHICWVQRSSGIHLGAQNCN